MNLILSLIIIIAISYILVKALEKAKISSEVTLIITGLIIGSTVLKDYLVQDHTRTILNLGNLALLVLMFIAGLESSWSSLYKEKKESALIAIFSFLTSFTLGFIVFYILTKSFTISFVVGICMSITAEATKADVLLDLKKLKSRVGAAMMGAGILDDIMGMLFFTIFILIVQADKISSYFFHHTLLILAIISYFLGILIHKHIGREHKHVVKFEKILTILLIPFFFITVGLNFNIRSLELHPLIFPLIIVVSISGKFIGVFLTKFFLDLNWKKLYVIGWAMNSRGAIEIALALIAFENNLIPVEIFSGLIIMALTTTLIFPFIIKSLIKNNKNIMK